MTQPALAIRLEAPDEARSGDSITLKVAVENRSGEVIDLYLRGRSPTLDAVLSTEDGRVVARLLDGEIGLAILQYKPLLPGELLEVSADFRLIPNIEAGSYVLSAFVLTDEPVSGISAARPIRVTDSASP